MTLTCAYLDYKWNSRSAVCYKCILFQTNHQQGRVPSNKTNCPSPAYVAWYFAFHFHHLHYSLCRPGLEKYLKKFIAKIFDNLSLSFSYYDQSIMLLHVSQYYNHIFRINYYPRVNDDSKIDNKENKHCALKARAETWQILEFLSFEVSELHC